MQQVSFTACSACGKRRPTGTAFCPFCGYNPNKAPDPTVMGTPPVQAQNQQPPPNYAPYQQPAPQQKQTSWFGGALQIGLGLGLAHLLIIGLVALLPLILLGGCGLVLMSSCAAASGHH